MELPVQTVFKMGQGRKLISFTYLIAYGVIFVIATGLCVNLIVDDKPLALILFLPLAVLMGFVMYWLIDEMTGTIFVAADRLTYRSLVSNKELKLTEIKGYRAYIETYKTFSRGKTISIYPVEGKGKTITVSKYVKDQSVLLQWLGSNFTNLEVKNYIIASVRMSQNHDYGATQEERDRNISSAKTAARVANVIGGILTVSLFVFSHPPAWVLFFAIAFVPATFLIVIYYKGIITYNFSNESPHPSIGFAVMFPGIPMLLKGVMSYDLVSVANPWTIGPLIAVGVWLLMLATTNEFSNRTSMDYANMFSFLFFLIMYGFGTFVITNCELDRREPKMVSAIVTAKDSNGKDYYSIRYNPPVHYDMNESTIRREQYHAIKVGDTVNLAIRPGRWGSEWYDVALK